LFFLSDQKENKSRFFYKFGFYFEQEPLNIDETLLILID